MATMMQKLWPFTRSVQQGNANISDLLQKACIEKGITYRLTLSKGRYYLEVEQPTYATWECGTIEHAWKELRGYVNRLS